ncbi:MAG: acyloxyacyl hydrolase [Desulfobacterales bacterium]
MQNTVIIKLLYSLALLLVLLGPTQFACAGDDEVDKIPTRYGMAAVLGDTFDPDEGIYFVQLAGFVMWDYDKVWHHWAPEALRFKVEGTAGLTTSPRTRGMISVGMMAPYYLNFISSRRLNPYIEGGIGVIYTDFHVEGQGSRFNFYPQAGIGTEIKVYSGPPFFGAVRISHISNAGLHDDNRGMNSVILMIGRFF